MVVVEGSHTKLVYVGENEWSRSVEAFKKEHISYVSLLCVIFSDEEFFNTLQSS